MKRALLLALCLLTGSGVTLAQDERFNLFITSSDVEDGGSLSGAPGSTITVNVSVGFSATEAGIAGVVAPVSIDSPGAPDDVTITKPDCDASCASDLYFGEDNNGEIFFYNLDVVDPTAFGDQGNGIILGLTTNIITGFSYDAGEFTVLDFTFDLTVPEVAGPVTVGFKNGLRGVGTAQNVTMTFSGTSVVPVTSALTFTVGPVEGGLIPGDTDLDGELDVMDVIEFLDHYFLGDPATLPCGDGTVTDAGNIGLLDGNGDGELDISDAIYSLRGQFLGGAPHVLGTDCQKIDGCAATSCDL